MLTGEGGGVEGAVEVGVCSVEEPVSDILPVRQFPLSLYMFSSLVWLMLVLAVGFVSWLPIGR